MELIKHNKYLDCLRGYAAITVLLTHFSGIDKTYIKMHPMAGLWNYVTTGHQAVILFFVLSGYVLSVSLNKNTVSYTQYVVRRIFRIYPLYLFTGVFVMILFFVSSETVLRRCFGGFYNDLVVSKMFLLNLISLISTVVVPFRSTGSLPNQLGLPLNSVTWSLSYEVLISLFFPFVYKMYMEIPSKLSYIIFLIQCIICFTLAKISFGAVVHIYYYSLFFSLGVILFRSQKYFCKYIYSNLWIVIGFILFCGAANNMWFSGFQLNVIICDFMTAAGSMIFITLCFSNNIFKALMNLFSNFGIGRNSYSIYLIHLPINFLCFYLAMDIFHIYLISGVNVILLKIVAIILVLFFSKYTYDYIEKPFILLGRKIL